MAMTISVAVSHVLVVPAAQIQARPVRQTQIAATMLAAATTNAAQIWRPIIIPVLRMTNAAAICSADPIWVGSACAARQKGRPALRATSAAPITARPTCARARQQGRTVARMGNVAAIVALPPLVVLVRASRSDGIRILR